MYKKFLYFSFQNFLFIIIFVVWLTSKTSKRSCCVSKYKMHDENNINLQHDIVIKRKDIMCIFYIHDIYNLDIYKNFIHYENLKKKKNYKHNDNNNNNNNNNNIQNSLCHDINDSILLKQNSLSFYIHNILLNQIYNKDPNILKDINIPRNNTFYIYKYDLYFYIENENFFCFIPYDYKHSQTFIRLYKPFYIQRCGCYTNIRKKKKKKRNKNLCSNMLSMRNNNLNVYNKIQDRYLNYLKGDNIYDMYYITIINYIKKIIKKMYRYLYIYNKGWMKYIYNQIYYIKNEKEKIIRSKRFMNEQIKEEDVDYNIVNDEKVKSIQSNEQKSYLKNNTLQYFRCFLDKAVENKNAKNELEKWIDPQRKSCYCSEESAEPCTSEDLMDINNINQIMDQTFCEHNNNNENNIVDNSRNNIFVALSDYKILKCNDKEKKNIIISQEKLYNYCKRGLYNWDNKNLYDYLNCSNVISYDITNHKTCIKKCENIKKLCNILAEFYSFEVCKKYYENNKHTEDIYINNFKYFNDHCKYFDPTNRGLILCKHKNVECFYSQWSDWSTCSKTCIENEYDTTSIRTRTRLLLNKFQTPSKSCSFIINEKNNLIDINFCSHLPSCNINNNIIKNDDDRIMPFVIPLKEIEKLNTLKYLNNDDNNLLNDNYNNDHSDNINNNINNINNNNNINECIVTDMYKYEYAISYNEKNKSCSCPNNQTPCYFKDIYNSQYWKKSLNILCKQNKDINVITADYIIIDCNMSISIKQKEIAINTYLAMTFNCHSDIFHYIFCSKNSQSIRTNFIYIIITCAFGFISAIYIIHLFINKWHIFKLFLHKQKKKKTETT
ncbi:hypothetical protein PGSY75_0822700 [Plasmodium gaboni]|uniref:Thrombospondin-related protein 1 n=1 Tax=Plasmodium gaboni TaxID=647221 RepID=A0A151LNQ9_9APIC|nr:hypothetical protein PGSY75_0822700 [Plasmodium gaboni]KYO00818.1 hypothetical protein PGSY75_0822700 [Plasmodium gaboni]